MNRNITFNYKNHRGEIRQRTIAFSDLRFIRDPGYGYQPGWFLYGKCLEKQEIRSFALCNIIFPADVSPFVLEPC